MHNSMRVSLSVDALSPNLSGIGRYCWELARGLRTDERITGLRYFVDDKWISDPEVLLKSDSVAKNQTRWRDSLELWWNHRRTKNHIVHAPNYFLPDWAERGVSTVHDLSVFKFPETHPVERVKAFQAKFAATVSRAELIVTDSEWVRREVIDFTGIKPEKVVAVPLGIGREFRPRNDDELVAFTSRHGLWINGYGLCVSTLEPRKRIGHLINAWRLIPKGLRERYPLVLAGGLGWRNESLLAQIELGEAEGWLRYLGYVNEADLPLLYAGARVFAYPSQYEGFGFPPLEAMACGVPAIVASGTCLEETAGAAAAVIDPEDTLGFAEELIRIIEDDSLHSEMASAGIEHASCYSWTHCVAATVSAYQSALNG